jgi:hypothetical protein
MEETKLVAELVDHRERLDRIEQRMNTVPTRDELFSKLDSMAKVLDRLDQERIFSMEWIRRIENDVDKIKKQLQIA